MATPSGKQTVAVKYKKIRLQELVMDKRDKVSFLKCSFPATLPILFQFFERGQFGDVKRAKWNNQEVAVKFFTLADRKGGFNEEVS